MWKIFKKLPNSTKWRIGLCIFISIFPSLFTMLIPQFVKQFIKISDITHQVNYVEILNWKIYPETISVLWLLVILTIVAALLNVFVNFASMRLSEYTISHIRHLVRMDLFKKLVSLSRDDIDEISYPTIITRFGNDISKINGGFFVICRSFANGILLIIWGFVFSLLTSLSLSIAIVVVLPLLIIGSIFAIKKIFPYYSKENTYLDKLNGRAKEDINGIELIKSYNLEEVKFNQYNDENKKLLNIGWKSAKTSGIAWPIINFSVSLGNIIVFLILGLTAHNFTNQNIGNQISNVFLFSSYLGLISSGVFQVCFESNKLFRAGISSKRVFEILNLESSIKPVNSDIKVENGNVEFKNVTFTYKNNKKTHALNDVSFKIPENSSVGIIGKTGSGKSTIVSLLLREIQPNNGKVLVGNHNIEQINTESFYRNISAVFQKPMLLSGSLKTNLSFAQPDVQNELLEKVATLSCADFIKEYEDEYEQIIGQHGINLSGGQKQRLAIAQGLLKNPKILILDDTTSALDNETDKKVRENILKNFKNTTLIVIAQRIKSIQNMDKIIVLNDGEIVGEGTHEELLKNNPYYQEIYKSQKEK
ncbi:ABC transporter ATP-binding protein [Mycoplasma hafezii]|uniref:ABC transporter ATP-binding protein n=1 Tax=Mycoplasma hafezii TaxID=525886 RepID=UPI003CE7246C